MERPANLPSEAVWSESDNEWIIASLNANGAYQGVVKYFRRDGTLCCETEHEDGTPHGKFRRFHESGEVSREGLFAHGKLSGLNVFLRTASQSTEKFPAGLGAAIWRCEMDYENNNVVGGRLFDKEGKRVREDGSPYPEKPPSNVPASAHFGTRDKEPRWIVGEMRDENGKGIRLGLWRYFTEAGTLACEEEYENGELAVVRDFDEETGAFAIERHLRGGKPHGPYARVVQDGDYTVAAVREEGQFDEGVRVGDVKLLDGAGNVVRVIDFGRPSAPETFDEIARAPASTNFAVLAKRLLDEKRMAALLMVAARDAASKKEARDFLSTMQTCSVPAPEESAAQITQMAVQVANNMKRFGADPGKLLKHYFGQIVLGAGAADMLSQAAVALDQDGDPAMRGTARDLIDAAILTDPSRVELQFSRALILMSCGRPKDSMGAMRLLAAHSEQQAAFLATYLGALFPRFDFGPATDERVSALANVEAPQKLVRSRDEIFAVASSYATRIAMRREALAALSEDATWLPPILTDYETVELDDEIEESVPPLAQSLARDWSCLSWACWLAGSDSMLFPAVIGDRPIGAFARLQAARLAVLTGEEVEDDLAMQATFAKWNDVLLAKMPDAFGEMAARDESALLELAMWMVDADAPSPFDAPADEEDEDDGDDDEENEDEDSDEDEEETEVD